MKRSTALAHRRRAANSNRSHREYDPVLPPRKRNWKAGDHQLGLFIRFPDGTVLEVSANSAKVSETEAALVLLKLLTRKTEDRTT